MTPTQMDWTLTEFIDLIDPFPKKTSWKEELQKITGGLKIANTPKERVYNHRFLSIFRLYYKQPGFFPQSLFPAKTLISKHVMQIKSNIKKKLL